jgi:hypothetical protein
MSCCMLHVVLYVACRVVCCMLHAVRSMPSHLMQPSATTHHAESPMAMAAASAADRNGLRRRPFVLISSAAEVSAGLLRQHAAYDTRQHAPSSDAQIALNPLLVDACRLLRNVCVERTSPPHSATIASIVCRCGVLPIVCLAPLRDPLTRRPTRCAVAVRNGA